MLDTRLRILLVEDNDGDADLVGEYVEEVGPGQFVLRRAETLAQAKALLTSDYDPQVILLDLNLPDSKGLNTLEEFCSDGETRSCPRPPIIVLTSLDDEDAANRAMASCAQAYLVKQDINASYLISSIRYAVQRHGKQTLARMARTDIPDSVEALQIIQRVNRVASALAMTGDPPRASGDQPQAAVGLFEQQALVGQAGEVVFISQDARLRDLEAKAHRCELTQARTQGELARLNDRVEPVGRLIQGNGRGPLANRLERLEKKLEDMVRACAGRGPAQRLGLARGILMLAALAVVGAVGGFVAALALHYTGL